MFGDIDLYQLYIFLVSDWYLIILMPVFLPLVSVKFYGPESVHMLSDYS